MSTEEFSGTACRQRFKGIENFLRRIAFNLGNTPSQTEVKIISCIPIDVTDLQQKILHLERQLDEAKNPAQIITPTKSKSFKQKTSVNTALCDPCFHQVSEEVSCKSLDCEKCTSPNCLNSRKKKSNVSFLFPDANECSTSRPQIPANMSYSSQYSEQQDPPEEAYIPKICDPRPCEHRRNIFKKKKKIMKKKQRSPYVYYAQTNTSSPFVKSELTEEVPHMNRDVMTRSYLSKMINKQYKPRVLGDNLSHISQFSSPICRDTLTSPRNICQYESDACSCCNGAFHNLDSSLPKSINPQIYMANEVSTGSAYYDTNQYDLVPVREKPFKIHKDIERPRKKEPKPQIDINCWPESVQTKKIRYYPVYVPPMVNYQEMPQHYADYRSRTGNPMRTMPLKTNRIEPVAKKFAKRRREINKLDYRRPTNIDTSKSCSIDFGNVYPKINHRKPKVQKSLQPIPVLKKNAECLTTVINNTECQTATSNVEAKAVDDKTEATLNQIKSILQSVLAEVKVSSQTKSQVSEQKPKRDAVVQKGPSQSIMQGSTLMNSFTYSPYAMNPNPYMASCSRNSTSNQLNGFPQSALKCFQNFPLFIQTPGRHICSNCYRNSPTLKSGYIKPATTTATNTDHVKDGHSKETEKLIKEIYKSMALNLVMPANKDTSQSGYEEITNSMNNFRNPVIVKDMKKPPNKIRNVVQAVSELFMKKDMVDTSETLNTTTESKLLPSQDSTRSHLTTTDTDVRLRKERLQKYLRTGNTQTNTEPEKRMYHEGVRHIATTASASESSTSESESDSTVVPPREVPEPKQKKEKHGLFSKMLQSVKLFKQRERSKKKENASEAATSSDSDDYQTIYSQKIEKNLNNRNRAYNLPKRKTHSKISYKQTYQRDRSPEKRRSPYMEQEYRRYWNERLMFHDDKRYYSSEQPYSSDRTPAQRATAYHRNYEARSALVEPKKPNVPKVDQNNFTFNRDDHDRLEPKLTTKGLAWLKKHKMGIHCGEQWKKLILEG